MNRQHAASLLVPASGDAATATVLGPDAHGWNEATIQALVHAHPACLPIREIDPLFADPIPLCTEMNTGAGQVDNVLVTASGLPVLVECKLWRNPQARREVVGQILDYAKELSRWTASDLQREVSRQTGKTVIDMVRGAGHVIDEIGFIDALTLNLRRGRFLLLIVGDGIREGVEAIAEYLQGQAGLHFTLGLVEMPIHAMPDGSRLVLPRVLARTTLITRTVVAAPADTTVLDADDEEAEAEAIGGMATDRLQFWADLVRDLVFDDPDQPLPKVTRQGYVFLALPMRTGAPWITIFRNVSANKVGLFLSYTRATAGERVVRGVLEEWSDIEQALGGSAHLFEDKRGRTLVQDELVVQSLADDAGRTEALCWLRARANDFVNIFRPRIRAVAGDLTDGAS